MKVGKKLEQQNKKRFLISILYYFVLCVLLFLGIKISVSYLLPIFIAVLVAHFSQGLAVILHKRTHISLPVCSVITVIAVFAAIIALATLLIYGIFTFVRSFFGDFAAIGEMLKGILENLRTIYSGFIHRISPEISEMLEGVTGDFISRIISSFGGAVSGFVTDSVKNIPSFFFSCVIALVAGCYIAKDYEGWKKFIKGLCSEKFLTATGKVAEVFKTNVIGILKGYFKLWIITFAELLAGFWILGIGYAPVLALIVSFVDLLPVFGTGTVLLPWAFAEFLTDNGSIGFGLVILYLVIIFIRNFLEPKIIGKQIGISPLLTLISMFLGFRLFGFWGLIILPIALITVIKYYKAQMIEEGF